MTGAIRRPGLAILGFLALGAAVTPEGAGRAKARLDLKAAPLADALAVLKEKLGVAYAARDEILAAAKPVTLAGELTRDEALRFAVRRVRGLPEDARDVPPEQRGPDRDPRHPTRKRNALR